MITQSEDKAYKEYYVKQEFLKQYPEYNTSEYKIEVIKSNRFDGDYEIYINHVDGYTVYWCKFWNNEAETTYEFVLEEHLNVMDIRFNIDIPEKYIYYDYDEEDYVRIFADRIKYTDYRAIEKNVVKQYFSENEMQIRYQLAQDILSGKIKIDCHCADTDSYDGPRNKVKIYKV